MDSWRNHPVVIIETPTKNPSPHLHFFHLVVEAGPHIAWCFSKGKTSPMNRNHLCSVCNIYYKHWYRRLQPPNDASPIHLPPSLAIKSSQRTATPPFLSARCPAKALMSSVRMPSLSWLLRHCFPKAQKINRSNMKPMLCKDYLKHLDMEDRMTNT